VISNGVLNGHLPLVPGGVFDFAKKNGENVFTWQPQRGTRVAMVLKALRSTPYSYVAVGRSLFEVEKREKDLTQMTLISWLLCVGVIMVHWIIAFLNNGKFANQ